MIKIEITSRWSIGDFAEYSFVSYEELHRDLFDILVDGYHFSAGEAIEVCSWVENHYEEDEYESEGGRYLITILEV